MKLNVCLILLVTISRGLCRETQCSKFDYEERLLEKMIRQEIKVEQMETEIKNSLKSISTFMADMEQRLNTKTVDIEQALNTKVGEMKGDIQDSLYKVTTTSDNMKQTIDTYTEDLQDKKNDVQLLADKVTVPRVAFNAYNLKNANIAATTGGTFIFTEVLINEGSGYDTNTGVFTAPVNGVYYFTVHMCTSNNKHVYYGIIVDGNTVAASHLYDKDHYPCNSVSTIVMLQTGSTVMIQSTSGASGREAYHTDAHYRNSFNGALLHK